MYDAQNSNSQFPEIIRASGYGACNKEKSQAIKVADLPGS